MLEKMVLRLSRFILLYHARSSRVVPPDQRPLNKRIRIIVSAVLPAVQTDTDFLRQGEVEQIQQRHEARSQPTVAVVLVDLVFGDLAQAVHEVEDVAFVGFGRVCCCDQSTLDGGCADAFEEAEHLA